MFAVGGIFLLLAIGFAASGMVSDGGGDDPDTTGPDAAPDEADTSEEPRVTEGSELSDLLFGPADPDVSAGDDDDDTLDRDGEEGADTCDGGGNDILRLGAGDRVSGEEGADVFRLEGTAPEAGEVPVITDFEPGIDQLVIEVGAEGGAPPEISLDTTASEGMTLVLANGATVAMLEGTGALSLSDIMLDTGHGLTPAMSDDEAGEDTADDAQDPQGDVLDGTEGDDTLTGGPGDDTLDGYSGDDLLDGGTGDDLLRGREGMDSLFGSGGNDAITGGVGDDLLDGGSENDALFGNEGNDSISGAGGADEAYGDEGNDTISGGGGTDFLAGGEGDDVISGGANGDLLFGNEGDDSLSGDGGDDYLQGGFGADTLEGGDGNDRLDGTFAAGDALFGPHDEDEGDTLDGCAGDDVIILGAGDIATGGEGSDSFITGSYIETGAEAGHVTDFDPARDVIEVMYDPAADPDPLITVEDFPDGTGAHVLFDGQIILSVTGGQGLDPTAITLREVNFDAQAETA